jgi:VWFA-related protein
MTRFFVALLLAGLPFAGAAQPQAETQPQTQSGAQSGAQSTSPTPPGPTLRASVDQVVVDVVVTDADGEPVTGLTAADFEVRERGRAQAVATFSEVSLPMVSRGPGVPLPDPGDVRSNQHARDGRIYVLVLDDANVALELTPTVHRAARYFIGRYVQPGDLVAVLTTTGLGVTRQEPTEDLALVDAAIGRFAGQGSEVINDGSRRRAETAYANRDADPMKTRRTSTTLLDDGSVDDKNDAADEGRERARITLRTLESVAASVGDLTGRRKTVIFFSQGAPVAAIDGEFLDLQRRVLTAAARANVAIYALDPNGLDHALTGDARALVSVPGSLDAQQLQRSRDMNSAMTAIAVQRRVMAAAMLRNLSEGTGGTATVDATNLQAPLDRIASDSSHYYLLGYTPSGLKRDGRYRPIEVRVKKPGLRVSARKGYSEPDDGADQKARDRSGPRATGPLADLIRRPVGTAGLPLRVTAVALPMAADNVRVVVEVGAQALTFHTKGDTRVSSVDLAIVPVGPGGQVLPAVEGHADLAIPAADAEAIREHGLRMAHRLTLAPGRYQLRVAARETAGDTSGSVIYDLSVPEVKRGLSLSAPVLSSRQASRIPSAERDEALERALGGQPPTTSRTFGTDDVLSAYAEAIDAGASTSRDIELTTIVRDAGGRELVKSPQPSANQGRAPGTSFAYAIDLPLKTLAPGRYTLRVEARAAGERDAVAREVGFEVRSVTP